MSEKILVKCKWTPKELHGESVEFKLPIEGGEARGLGQFVVTQEAGGLLCINIRTNLQGDEIIKSGTYDFHVNQHAADHIEKHPEWGKAAFRCHA